MCTCVPVSASAQPSTPHEAHPHAPYYNGRVPVPTVLKPQPLWTGEQVFSLFIPSEANVRRQSGFGLGLGLGLGKPLANLSPNPNPCQAVGVAQGRRAVPTRRFLREAPTSAGALLGCRAPPGTLTGCRSRSSPILTYYLVEAELAAAMICPVVDSE